LNPQEAETWFQAVMPQFRDLMNDGNEEVDMGDYIQALLAQGLNETVLGRNATMREIAGEAVELARLHKYDRLFASAIALRGLAYSFEMTPDLLLEMEGAVQLCRLKGYFHELALLLMMLGGLNYLLGDTQKGKQYLEELEQVRENIRSPLGLAIITESLGGLAFVGGDLESARLSTVETIEIFEKLGAGQNLVMARSRLGHILRRIGDTTGAKDIYRQTILSWQELGNLAAIAHQLECFAFLAIADGNHRRAAILIGAAKATRKRLNAPNENPMELVDMKQALAQLAESIGEGERDRVMAEGAKLNLDEAVALALKEVT
jgi:tetratricopeptide (TPR) repeat protein